MYSKRSAKDDTRKEVRWESTRYSDPPPNRLARYSLPPSSGIVVNNEERSEKKSLYADASNIYFVPKMTTAVEEDVFTKSLPLGKPLTELRAKPASQDTERSVRPSMARMVSSVHQEKPVSTPISRTSRDIKVQVPPFFTWAVGKRSEAVDSLEGNVLPQNIGPGHAANAKDPAAEQQCTVADRFREEGETLDNLSDHINAQLLEMRQDDEDVLYRNATTTSLSAVEKAIESEFKTSALALMNRGLGAQETQAGSDIPVWRSDMRCTAGSLFRLFDYFIPLAYACGVADSYWGALHDILTVSVECLYCPAPNI